MFSFSIRPTFLLVLIGGSACCIYVFYSFYLLIGLLALNLACRLLAPIAKRRGWGAEGRLTRHLSRPPFADESRKAT